MENGVFAWTGFHHGISASHTDADVDAILERLDTVMRRIV
jgi:glutamate-1-semialdehyde aminotransferase